MRHFLFARAVLTTDKRSLDRGLEDHKRFVGSGEVKSADEQSSTFASDPQVPARGSHTLSLSKVRRWVLDLADAADKKELSDEEKKTQEYDKLAFRLVSYAAIPLLAGYTVYSCTFPLR